MGGIPQAPERWDLSPTQDHRAAQRLPAARETSAPERTGAVTRSAEALTQRGAEPVDASPAIERFRAAPDSVGAREPMATGLAPAPSRRAPKSVY